MAQPQAQPSGGDATLVNPSPTFIFWLLIGLGYVVLLALGLGFPLLGRMTARLNLLVNMLGYILSDLSMIGASFFLSLMICRVKLPYVWWMQRIRGEDVSEFEGVFFVGGSVERLSSSAQRRVFSADDKMSRWDITFGVMISAFSVVHGGVAILTTKALRTLVFAV